jgi:hypothetical protein
METKTQETFSAVFFRVEEMRDGTYQLSFRNVDRDVLKTMRPGDTVEIRKLEK